MRHGALTFILFGGLTRLAHTSKETTILKPKFIVKKDLPLSIKTLVSSPKLHSAFLNSMNCRKRCFWLRIESYGFVVVLYSDKVAELKTRQGFNRLLGQ